MALPHSIARPGETFEGEAVTTRYGLEHDTLPDESFYVVCAYDVDASGATVARRVLGKSASHAAAVKDVVRLRADAGLAA